MLLFSETQVFRHKKGVIRTKRTAKLQHFFEMTKFLCKFLKKNKK